MSTMQIPIAATSPRVETGAATSPRIETGTVQFGDDWPGLFIRGDNAIMLAASIRILVAATPDEPAVMSALMRSALARLADITDVIERDVVVGQVVEAKKAAGKKGPK